MKTCVAWMNDVAVGELREEPDGVSFVYSAGWLHRPDRFALSGGLPLQSIGIHDMGPLTGVGRYLSSVLPPSGERLMRIAMEAGLQEKDRLGLLLHYGEEGMGALAWRAPGRQEAGGGRQPLSPAAALQLLQAGKSPHGGILPGASPKLAVIQQEDGSLWERSGQTASTHLLKAATGGPEGRALLISEWLLQHLASAVDLPALVPELHYWGESTPILLSGRFDRLRDPFGRHQKLCLCLAGQLINVDQDHPLSPDVLGRVEGHCLIPIQARRDLYRWAVFNILVMNVGVHLNKLAVLRWTNGWMLAPFFGLKSLGAIKCMREGRLPDWSTVRLPFRLGERGSYGDLDMGYLGRFGEAMGIHRRTAEELAEQVAVALQDAIDLPLPRTLRSEDTALADWLMLRVLPGTIDLLG